MNISKTYIYIFFLAFAVASCSPHKKLATSNEGKHSTTSEEQLKKKYGTLLM
jgi:hypothetical protein